MQLFVCITIFSEASSLPSSLNRILSFLHRSLTSRKPYEIRSRHAYDVCGNLNHTLGGGSELGSSTYPQACMQSLRTARLWCHSMGFPSSPKPQSQQVTIFEASVSKTVEALYVRHLADSCSTVGPSFEAVILHLMSHLFWYCSFQMVNVMVEW